MNGFTLRREYGQRSANLVPGKVELESLGTPGTTFSGEFTAEVRSEG